MTNIAALRKKKKCTQEDLAKACNVDRATVSKWEIGVQMPRAKKLCIIAKFLGCTIEEVFKPADIKEDMYHGR